MGDPSKGEYPVEDNGSSYRLKKINLNPNGVLPLGVFAFVLGSGPIQQQCPANPEPPKGGVWPAPFSSWWDPPLPPGIKEFPDPQDFFSTCASLPVAPLSLSPMTFGDGFPVCPPIL